MKKNFLKRISLLILAAGMVIWGGAESASATNLDKWTENGKHAGGLGQYFSAHLPNAIHLLLTDALICTKNLDLPHIIHSTAYDITGDGKEELFFYIETTLEHYDNKGSFYIFSPKEDSGYFLLAENHNFRAGFTEILACDGTVLLPTLDYQSASSWKGGIRYYLEYRKGQIVVAAVERYRFQWDAPMINEVNDYQNGLFFVYVARPEETDNSMGRDIDANRLKIYEEVFSPKLIFFSDLEDYDNAAAYHYDPTFYPNYHPFDEGWWEQGGAYPAYEGESGPGIADWLEVTAVADSPDEILREAVTQSGYEMERIPFPWTEETKRNTEELLRCQAADYYYISEDYTAFYIRGTVYFYER